MKRSFVNGALTAGLTTASVGVNTTNGVLLRNGGAYSDDRMAAFYSGAGLFGRTDRRAAWPAGYLPLGQGSGVMGSPIRGILIGVPVSLALWGCGFYAARAGLDVPPAPPPDMAAIAAQAAAQVQQMVPAPSMQTPPPAALDSVQGTGTTYARARPHPRGAGPAHGAHHRRRRHRDVDLRPTHRGRCWQVPPVAYMVEDLGSPVVVQVVGRADERRHHTDTHTAVTIKWRSARARCRRRSSRWRRSSASTSSAFRRTGTKVNLFAADPTQ